MPSRHENELIRKMYAAHTSCEFPEDALVIGEAIVSLTQNIVKRQKCAGEINTHGLSPEERRVMMFCQTLDSKIEAIKYYRSHIDSGLIEAKRAVERLEKWGGHIVL